MSCRHWRVEYDLALRSFPVALVLAMSFGFYGLCKKIIHLGAVTGIAVETMFISPFALLYLYYAHSSGVGAFALNNPGVSLVLAGAGVVTAIPLILFAGGTKRLPLSIIGFLQYTSPTIALILGVFLFHETFNRVHLVSVILIWVALTVFPGQNQIIYPDGKYAS